MERESNPLQAMCRSGCGFYGNPATEGLCSKCFKETLKKKQQPPNPPPTPSPSANVAAAAAALSSFQAAGAGNSPTASFLGGNASSVTPFPLMVSSTGADAPRRIHLINLKEIRGDSDGGMGMINREMRKMHEGWIEQKEDEDGMPELAVGAVPSTSDGKTGAAAARALIKGPKSPLVMPESPDSPEKPGSDKKKKTRCISCRKKLGLTGFECRCGGMYCSVHRYSDKHACTFDYREMGAEEIRRNNPVVVGEKIQKI